MFLNFNRFFGLCPFVKQVNTHLNWIELTNWEKKLLSEPCEQAPFFRTYTILEHNQILTRLVWHLTTNHFLNGRSVFLYILIVSIPKRCYFISSQSREIIIRSRSIRALIPKDTDNWWTTNTEQKKINSSFFNKNWACLYGRYYRCCFTYLSEYFSPFLYSTIE